MDKLTRNKIILYAIGGTLLIIFGTLYGSIVQYPGILHPHLTEGIVLCIFGTFWLVFALIQWFRHRTVIGICVKCGEELPVDIDQCPFCGQRYGT
ncbi:MAG: hypothetical protein HZB92_05225 [Euryarchaeota archaeon]|nr:hypothetical protein [Euryarchaeota archaeon]